MANKGFYTVVFYPLKTGKKVTVNSIGEVEALVRNADGRFTGFMSTRKQLAITENKLYFYKKAKKTVIDNKDKLDDLIKDKY